MLSFTRGLLPALIALSLLFSGLGLSTVAAQPAPTVPAQTVAPERMELGARLVRAAHLDSALRLGMEVAWRAQREEIETAAKSAPPERAHKILAIWDEAVLESQSAFIDGLEKRLQVYFATSKASDEQLRAYLAFYDSELGRRIAPPNVASAEDRQAAGKYLLDHPGALDALPIVMGATDVMNAYGAEHRHALSVEVGRRFCRGLYKARITKTLNCPAP